MSELDFSNTPAEEIAEVHRQGELCLQGTLQLALAADQRASMMAGIFGAGAVALLAAAATILGSEPVNTAFLYAVLAAALGFFVGMILCALAVLPVHFYVAGYEPKKLCASAADKTWILRYASVDLQRRIDENRHALDRASRRLKSGLVSGLLSPVVATVIYVLLWF